MHGGTAARSKRAFLQTTQTLLALGTAAQEITATLDVETVLVVLLHHVGALLEAPFAAIYLLDESSGRLFAQQPGPSEPGAVALEDPGSNIARAARERREVHGAPGGCGPASQLCAPMIASGRLIGVLCIRAPRPRAYAQGETMILRTIAAYGAIGLNHARTLDALARAQAQLEHLAYSDGLTHLPNRRLYNRELGRLLARSHRHTRRFALLLIDLDRFKLVNDTLGHDTGDALLAEVAARLQASLRKGDFVARLGGDEFALLLGDITDEAELASACARLADCFQAPIPVGETAIKTSISVGAAIYPDDARTAETLYRAADQALYCSKRGGRDTWRKAS